MKRAVLVVTLIFSLGLNLGLLIRAYTPRAPEPTMEPVDGRATSDELVNRPRGRGQGLNPRRIADELGLEGEVLQRFREIRRDFFQQTQDHRRQVSQLQGELRELLSQPEIDRARVAATVDALGEAHRGLEGLFVDRYLATLEILDTEQREIYRRHVLDRVVGRSSRLRGSDP